MKNFNDLSEGEILALAISLEEEDERVYADFAEGLHQDFPHRLQFSTPCKQRSPATDVA